jgi:HrpA-like RNA helicase
MPLPTLLEKGTIEGVNYVAKDYIIMRVKSKITDTPKNLGDKVMIIEAGTASGKSVTIPPEIHKKCADINTRNVIVTQPRQVSAIRTVQVDIIKFYDYEIGKDIGYQTSSFTRKPIKGLVFVTIGTLLQQFKIMTAEQLMAKYGVIIIDEAHERSIETDLTIYFIKTFLEENWENPKCPLFIFMSATLEKDVFMPYFNHPELIQVKGRTYPITEFFLPNPSNNYIYAITDRVMELHNRISDYTSELRDILVFTFGDAPIKRIKEILDEYNTSLPDNNKLCIIKFTTTTYSEGGEDAKWLEADIEGISVLIGDKYYKPKRKVILSTNVAETSLTIVTLKYVIDSGMVRQVEFDSLNAIVTNIIKPVSKDMAIQRKGRVGRVAPGETYPIYTEDTFNKLQNAKLSDMITNDISACLLALIVNNGGYDGTVKLLEDFPSDSIWYAMEKLQWLGAITFNDLDKSDVLNEMFDELSSRRKNKNFYYIPTNVGILMNKFRKIKLENIRMITSGYHFGANILDLITITALLETSNLLARTYKPRKVYESAARNVFLLSDTFIDLIFLFEEFNNQDIYKVKDWCFEQGVNYTAMMSATEYRDTIIEDMMYAVGLDPLYNSLSISPIRYSLRNILLNTPDIGIDEIVKLKNCIAMGYIKSIAKFDDDKRMYITNRGVEVKCPDNLFRSIGECCKDTRLLPRYIAYNNIVYGINRGEIETKIEYYSVLDNFVNIDYTIL